MSHDETDLIGETERLGAFQGDDAELSPCVLVLSGDSAGQLFRLRAGTNLVGRAEEADLVLTDRGISRRHAQFTVSPDKSVVLSDLGSTNGTFVGSERVEISQLFGGERLRLGAGVKMKFDFHDKGEERLIEGVARDGLTGALNRAYFEQRLQEACAKASRHNTSLVCAFIDADHFKSVNDTHGHAAGDEVLVELVCRISKLKRKEDTFCRYGGEEFVMLLPGTDLPGAIQLLERVRESVASRPFPIDSKGTPKEIKVTISIGVASFRDAGTAQSLVELADRAVYDAKEAGRNVLRTRPLPRA